MHPYFNIFSRQIPAYGTMMMLGMLVAGTIGMLRVRRAGLKWEDAIVLLVCGFGFGLLGAAGLYMAVTYSWNEIFEMMRSGELFTGKKTGLVFYGGLIGCIPGVLVGKSLTKTRLADYVQPMVPCIPLGHAFGRVGCLLAGCCYGMPVDGLWGVIYQDEVPGVPQGVRLFPVQAVESLVLVIIFVILLRYCARKRDAAQIVGLYAMSYALCRFVLEFLRYDAVRGHWGLFSTSQWISAMLFCMGGIVWIMYRRRSARKNGVV